MIKLSQLSIMNFHFWWPKEKYQVNKSEYMHMSAINWLPVAHTSSENLSTIFDLFTLVLSTLVPYVSDERTQIWEICYC